MEPVEGMRRVLVETQPGLPVARRHRRGAAPCATASVDAVTVAQAFHWFDADAAFAELARVAAPRRAGRADLERTRPPVAWVDELWSVMDRVERRAPWRDHEQWSHAALGDRPGFGPLHEATFHHTQPITPDGIVERFASVSHVAVLSEPDRQVVLDEIRDVLARHPDTAGRGELAIPYRVDAYWCERR